MRKYLIAKGVVFTISSFSIPLFLLIAFNFMKGIQTNDDGKMFIPIGIILVVATVAINIFLTAKILKTYKKPAHIIFFYLALVIIFFITFTLTYSAWYEFFRCLAHYKGFNLESYR